MKFTSEDLMKAMGLQVGDRIKANQLDIFEIKLNEENEPILYVPNGRIESIGISGITNISLDYLINNEIEILPRLKRIGDLKCKEFECSNCPMRMICMHHIPLTDSEYTLYDMLKELEFNPAYSDLFDQEIHDLLKARLDKEVEE